jgi:glycosyltransferase involved in cell wall biosynthesis
MATFNGAEFIGEQLESLARQTLLPAELLVGDDGSTDATVAIVEAFAAEAPFPVRIIRNDPPLGWVENFLATATQVTGDLISFCDQDDVWLQDKLEFQVAAFTDPRVQVAICNSTPTDVGLQPRPDRRHTGIVNRARWAGIYIAPPGNRTIYRAQLIHALPYQRRPLSFVFENEPSTYDEWMFFLAQAFGRRSMSNRPLVLWRRHDVSVTGIQARASRRTLLSRPPRHGLERRRAAVHSRFELAADVAANGSDPAIRAVFARQRERYRRLERNLVRRVGLHETSAFPLYVLRLLAELGRGTYGWQYRGGLGWLDLLQDLIRMDSDEPDAAEGKSTLVPGSGPSAGH